MPWAALAILEAAILAARSKLGHGNDIALIVMPSADLQARVHDARTMGRCSRRRLASHLPDAFMGITLLEESGVDARYLLAPDGGVHRF